MFNFDLLILYVKDALVILSAVAAYFYLIASVYPRFTLRMVWKRDRRGPILGDRGVRKLVFPEGRAIVYEPALAYRRFIRRYALIKRDGCTYIQCRIHDAVAHIRYDVAAFDRRGRLLDVLRVSERITEAGQTQPVRLPRDTAYACVTLRKADAMYENREATMRYSFVGLGIYAGLTVISTMAASLALRYGLDELLTTIPLDRYLRVEGVTFSEICVTDVGITLAVSALIGLAVAAWGLLMYHIHASKVVNR